ncbi:MAG TPA: gliding motility protein GldN [Bacteroidia bacterium]|jgi:gliding motility associated protien GldN|nr:gliding motility protein GldN [Bacteroidia bacterium]
MKKIFYIFMFFYGTLLFSQTKKQAYEDKQVKAEYHLKNGLMDGKYISHYPNGKKKAEGNFKDNLRVGKWDVWDSTGKLHADHIFKSDSLIKNKDGYVNYTYLKEADVAIWSRIWRNVYKENNPLLFGTASLFDTLYSYIQRDSLIIYKDEEYTTQKSKEDIKTTFSSDKYEIVAYKFKEDWFFDKKINATEIRVLGIYPVLRPKNSENEENMGLGWIYFPQARKLLASQKLWDKHYPNITNLDEMFWYRHYASQIFKENNVYDRPISSYSKTPGEALLEAERIEIGMIESEHNIWLYGDQLFFHPPK